MENNVKFANAKNPKDNSYLFIKMALRDAGLHAVGFGTMIYKPYLQNQ